MQHRLLVFTDLDGSLLDHNTYSFEPAVPLLERLSKLQIPVIPVTSKTRAELSELRSELNNNHPFIVENGAAIFIPKGYFPLIPNNCDEIDNFYCHSFSEPRSHWKNLLDDLKPTFSNEFTTFSDAGIEGITKMTGLSSDKAFLANQRDFSEPVKWLGSDERRAEFITRLKENGATVLQGGRFLHVLGACDKGQALRWLVSTFKKHSELPISSIAAGDSYNDVAMLNAVNAAVTIRSPVQNFPSITNTNSYQTESFGPQGWVEGIEHFMAKLLP